MLTLNGISRQLDSRQLIFQSGFAATSSSIYNSLTGFRITIMSSPSDYFKYIVQENLQRERCNSKKNNHQQLQPSTEVEPSLDRSTPLFTAPVDLKFAPLFGGGFTSGNFMAIL